MSDRDQEIAPEAQALVDQLWETSTAAKNERRRQRNDVVMARFGWRAVVVVVVMEVVFGVAGLVSGLVTAVSDSSVAFDIAIGCGLGMFAITAAHKAWLTGPMRAFDAPLRVLCTTLAGVGVLLALGTINPMLYLLAILLVPAWFAAH